MMPIVFEVDVTNPGTGDTDTWYVCATGDVPHTSGSFNVHDNGHGTTRIRSVNYGFNDNMDLAAHVILEPIVIDGDPEEHADAPTVMTSAGWTTSYAEALKRDARRTENRRVVLSRPGMA